MDEGGPFLMPPHLITEGARKRMKSSMISRTMARIAVQSRRSPAVALVVSFPAYRATIRFGEDLGTSRLVALP